MIFNHPSAYIYTSSCSTSYSSPSRGSYLQWTPEPHVGASEGPAWSPYLKSPLSIAPRSDAVLPGCVPDPVRGTVEGVIRSQAITIPRSRSWGAFLEQTEQDFTPPLSPSSVSSSLCSSFSELDDDDDDLVMADERSAFEGRKRRTTLDSMVREPPCPIPSQTKVIAL